MIRSAFQNRRAMLAGAVCIVAMALLATATALAVCSTTSYSVTSSAPPPIGNWTDTTGAVWSPAGGFPGCATGDTASDTNGSPTTLIINSAIPNPIVGLNLACSSCTIDIQSGGQLTLAGAGSIASATNITVESGGTLTLANGATLTIANGASLSVNGGFVDVQSGATLTINGASTVTSSGTLNVAGTMHVNNTFTVQSSGEVTLGGATVDGSSNINNSGTIYQSGSDSTISAVLNNNSGGSVEVMSGTLHVSGGGTGDSGFLIDSGATLDFPASYTTTANGTISGAGTLQVSGGTLSIGGVTTVGGFTQTGGTLTGAGFLSATSSWNWSAGTVTGSGGRQLAGNGMGYFTGTGGTLNIDGSTIDIYGHADDTAANGISILNGGTLNVYGTFELQSDTSIADGGGGTNTVNVAPNGFLEKSGGSGISTIATAFNNSASVYGGSGTLNIAGSGSDSGSFTNTAGATIAFSGSTSASGSLNGNGTYAFPAGLTSVTGSYQSTGLTSITGGTLQMLANGSTTTLTLDGGQLSVGSGVTFDVTGGGTWSAGSMTGSGVVTLDAGGTLALNCIDGNAVLNGPELDNNGTINYTAPSPNEFMMTGALLVNNGTFDIQTDQAIDQGVVVGAVKPPAKPRKRAVLIGGSSIENNGTFQKSAGTGTTLVVPALTNTATVNALSGTMSFTNTYDQTAGSTNLSGGNITVASPLTLDGGTLTGAGTITGDVQNNSGNVTPGTASTVGTITVTGNYTQASSGALSVKIADATNADLLANGAAATLDGTFNQTFLSGYAPPPGLSWTVFTFASRTGDFAVYNFQSDPFGAVQSSYTPTSLVLSIAPASTDLAIGMTGPASVNANAPLNFDITVTNNGPNTATGTITVADTLPTGATYTGASGSGWSCGAPSGGVVTCTNNTILASATSLPTLTIGMVPPPNSNATNSATVSTTTSDPNSSNNTASVTTTVTPEADVQVTKSGPAGVTAGSNVTYTMIVTNNGPSTANSVTLSDPTPANLTFVSATGCASFPCSLGTLTSGQSVTVTATYSTSPSFSGNVTNTATVSSTTSDPTASNNSASATTNVGLQADLSIAKTGPPTANPGQTITYTINFTNGGPSPATNTTITDVTPPGLAFQSNSGACTTQFPCNVGTLASGQSGSITSTYTIIGTYNGASITNTASIASGVNDPNTANNSSSATTNVIQQTDLSINKSGPPSATPGSNVVYTITVSNLGPSSAANVSVSDTTPAGLTFVSNTGACTTAFPCALGTMTPGQTATITSTFSIPANYSGTSVTNTATVSSLANDPNPSNDSSTVTTPVTTSAGATDVSITKSGPASVSVGQNVTYTIVVTNNSTVAANNVFVSDATPAGTTFVSNSGACASAFPCALGTLGPGGSATIQSTYNVPQSYAGASVTNTASVSTSTPDSNSSNNTATAITPVSTNRVADLQITKRGPADASIGSQVTFTIAVYNAGPNAANTVVVSDPTPAGLTFVSNSGACTTAFPCTIASLAPGQTATINAKYTVNNSARGSIANTASVTSAASDPNPSNNSSTAGMRTSGLPLCPTVAPQILTPALGASLLSPVTLSWNAVPHAQSYFVTINGIGVPQTIQTNQTSATVTLPSGGYSWSVLAMANGCQGTSASSSFSVCSIPAQPVASVVGEATTGQTYTVAWPAVDGAASYELQEANDAGFTNANTIKIPDGTSNRFTKTVTTATPFFYRVRAISACNSLVSAYSDTVSVVVVPVPAPNTPGGPSLTAPFGSTQPLMLTVFIPGLPGGTTTFLATTDRPWMSVAPTSGIITPDGLNLTVSLDPSGLANGTWTGDVIVVYGSATVTGTAAPRASSTTTSVPVSVSIVTPVTPGKLTGPAANALIIPSIGHISGLSSEWRSDVRVANPSSAPTQFLLTFNPGNGTQTKQTTITVDAGATTALDDIARNWFGIGSMGDSGTGALIVTPLANRHARDVSVATTAVVTSRTYNAAASGTVGQFIPAVPFASFIDASGKSSLILQQIAQSDAFHTNVGILEAAGKPANVVVSTYDASGNKLLDTPLSINAGELRNLGSFLAQNNITLTNGRIQVTPQSGDGKVTAYASVVDSHTNDPFLVSGVTLNTTGATRFILPGIADLNTGGASWRSDVRIFNGSAAPQTATLTFYPLGNASGAASQNVTINPGEVKALDGILQSTFGVTNAGGTLHVTTAAATPLIVSARTYDQTSGGTLGQFIPATTLGDAVGASDRALQLVQLEDSTRYRTNIGIAEVNGKSATVEVQVVLPDSKVSPKAQIALGAYDSRQFDILGSLGLGAVYNARVSVRVIDGEGKVTAYGSVIDQKTQAPVYVPAQ